MGVVGVDLDATGALGVAVEYVAAGGHLTWCAVDLDATGGRLTWRGAAAVGGAVWVVGLAGLGGPGVGPAFL